MINRLLLYQVLMHWGDVIEIEVGLMGHGPEPQLHSVMSIISCYSMKSGQRRDGMDLNSTRTLNQAEI